MDELHSEKHYPHDSLLSVHKSFFLLLVYIEKKKKVKVKMPKTLKSRPSRSISDDLSISPDLENGSETEEIRDSYDETYECKRKVPPSCRSRIFEV